MGLCPRDPDSLWMLVPSGAMLLEQVWFAHSSSSVAALVALKLLLWLLELSA